MWGHCSEDTASISPEVHNLGIIRDCTLSFQSHIQSINKFAFKHLQIGPSFYDPMAETFIHALISSCLDYCNTLYFGITQSSLSRFQLVQDGPYYSFLASILPNSIIFVLCLRLSSVCTVEYFESTAFYLCAISIKVS